MPLVDAIPDSQTTAAHSILPHKVHLEDPSEFRPDHRDPKDFRDFRIHNVPERVVRTYKMMHTYQTVDYVKSRMHYWLQRNHGEMAIMEILDKLNELVDESDPDIDLPNAMHAFQTAEGIRQYHPDKPWFQLVGLIHDIGKIMAIWGEPQWSTVGDTFVVGCAPVPEIVFGVENFVDNPDVKDPRYNTKYGVYSPNCGLENVQISWGHDEYLYQVLKTSKHFLPEEALYIIRFHSFYPYHSCGAYRHLSDEKDEKMLKWIKEFNKFDLYTKAPKMPPIDELRHYYQGLIDTYLPGKFQW